MLFNLVASTGAARAADSDGSMDAIWSEMSQGQPQSTKSESKSHPAAAPETTVGVPSTLCPLHVITESALIKKGGWPGIGPFRDTGGEYIDAEMNRLKVLTKGDDVTAAELHVSTPPRGFINLEMTADFLLESVGAQANKIADFNLQLEKRKMKLLASTADNPLNLSAGPYNVSLHKDSNAPQNSDSTVKKQAFVIQVRSSGSKESELAGTSPPSQSRNTTVAMNDTNSEKPTSDRSSTETSAPEPKPAPEKKPEKRAVAPVKHVREAARTPKIKTIAPPDPEPKVEAVNETSKVADETNKSADEMKKAADSAPVGSKSEPETIAEQPGSSKAGTDAHESAVKPENSDSKKSDSKKSDDSSDNGKKSKSKHLFGGLFKSHDKEKVTKKEKEKEPEKSSSNASAESETAAEPGDLKPRESSETGASGTETAGGSASATGSNESASTTNDPLETASTEVNGWQTGSSSESKTSTSSEFTITKPSLAPRKVAMATTGSHVSPAAAEKPKPTSLAGSGSTTAAAPKPADSLKQQFQTIVEGWQKVKRIAVKERKTDELPLILSGKTLQKQSDAIKWLSEHHMYYEMSPEGVSVKKLTPVIKDHKYLVTTEIQEASKLIDESKDNAVVKESDSTYTVNYTLEKVQGKWMITDSQLLDPNSSKPQSASKTTR